MRAGTPNDLLSLWLFLSVDCNCDCKRIFFSISGTFDAHQLTDEKVNNMTNYLLDLYKTSTCWQLTYGTVDFLNFLKLQKQFGSKNGNFDPQIKLGVISNFDSRLDVLLRNMKLNHYFDFVLGSYQAGFEKPDKDIFKMAMRASEIKDLKPEECLHIGNTPVTDYFGPRHAGWYSLLIHERPAEKLRQKYGETVEDHHVYQNFIDLHKDISNSYIKFWTWAEPNVIQVVIIKHKWASNKFHFLNENFRF